MMAAGESDKRILILLGGAYHDFDTFEEFAARVFDDFNVRFTRDPSDVASPDADIVLIYTCYLEPPSDPNGTYSYLEGISDDDSRALTKWVGDGGGLLALHSATTLRKSNTELKRLLGGRFISHPPRFPFTVVPMAEEHPITKDVECFLVNDELYTQVYSDVDIHMVAVDRGIAHPMVWTRREGRGRVAHIAPGHDESTWRNPSFQKLLRQAMVWLHPSVR